MAQRMLAWRGVTQHCPRCALKLRLKVSKYNRQIETSDRAGLPLCRPPRDIDLRLLVYPNMRHTQAINELDEIINWQLIRNYPMPTDFRPQANFRTNYQMVPWVIPYIF